MKTVGRGNTYDYYKGSNAQAINPSHLKTANMRRKGEGGRSSSLKSGKVWRMAGGRDGSSRKTRFHEGSYLIERSTSGTRLGILGREQVRNNFRRVSNLRRRK